MRLLLRSISLFLLFLAFASEGVAQITYEPYAFTTLAGNPPDSTDGTGDAARFFQPSGIAADNSGNIFVCDTYNHTIRKITSGGVVTTLAGLGGASGSINGVGSAARFSYPTGLAVDSGGNLYVASAGAIRKVAPSGAVTTFAGSLDEYGSEDGTGAAARFNAPNGLALDATGNLYVADGNNHIIRKITPAGAVTTFAGLAETAGTADGIGNAARFNNPRGLAVDNAGNVYVADSYNHTIRKISPAGAVTTLAGLAGTSGNDDGYGSAARFLYPWSLALDSAGNIFVADAYNDTIRKVTTSGLVTTVVGQALSQGNNDGNGVAARLSLPQALTIDSTGNIIVADTNNCAIRRITPGFTVTTMAGRASPGSDDGPSSTARFQGPTDVQVDGNGNIYIADSLNHTVRKINPRSVVTTLAGLAGNSGSSNGNGSAARFSNPSGVAVDSGGNVYVADFGNCTIRKIDPTGAVFTLAGWAYQSGSSDGTGYAARFAYPYHLAVDGGGTVYVADAANHTIRKITPAGVVTTLAGLAGNSGSIDGQGSAARFNDPHGIAIDASGNLWVTESSHTIRKVTANGVVTTVAGLAGRPGNADGNGQAARFSAPRGIVVGADSNIYVADSGNASIRKITPSGNVTTLAGSGYQGSKTGPANVARFFEPVGIAVDSSGKVYVADSGNNAIRVGVPLPPPANDNFADAIVLNSSSGNLEANNFVATKEAGEPDHGGYAGGRSVWFQWTAPQDGVFAFQLSDSSFFTLLGIYTGSQVNALSWVADSIFNQRVLLHAKAGTTYHIAVDGYNGDSGSFNLSWALISPPPNDNFANATAVNGTSGNINGDNTSATKEGGEPNHGGYVGGSSVWYRWTATQDGYFNFQLSSSSSNTLEGIYTGSQVSSLTTVASGINNHPVAFRVVTGTTYYIAVDGISGYSGSFTIEWSQVTSPSNDNFDNALLITEASGSSNGSNIAATRESAEPYHAGFFGNHSVWFKWVAPQDGVFAFEFVTSSFGNLLGIYTGTQLNALTPVANSSSTGSAAFRARAGATYYIAVDGNEGDSGFFTLNWRIASPPVNDDFMNAASIIGASGSFTSQNLDATMEAGEPRHADYPGGHSVWCKWVAPQSGVFAFQVAESSFNSLLGIYTGSQVNALTSVANIRFYGNAAFRAIAGTTYYIAVDGYSGGSGSFTLSWNVGNPPPNDDFVDAATITGLSGSLTSSNSDATRESGEPNHADYSGGHSLWYKWTAPQTGVFAFQVSNVSFSDLLGIYTGSQVNMLTSAASARFGGSALLRATAGSTYYIAIDGYGGTSGSFTLSWMQISAPSNDDFVNAAAIGRSSGSVSSNTHGATRETGEPYHAGYSTGHSVWYKWTAPQSGSFAFQISNASFSSVLAIYTGSEVSMLTEVTGSKSNNSAAFSAIAGTSYYLAVDGSGDSAGFFTLTWNQIAPPANDDFVNATLLSGLSGTLVGSNLAATGEVGEPIHSFYYTYHSVWYKWTAPQDGVFAFQAGSSDFSGSLAIYTGSSISALTVVTESNIGSRLTIRAGAGISYYILIGSYDGRAGTFTLAWEAAPPPSNDDLANARAIGASTGSSVGSLANATVELGEPNHLGKTGQHSVWYAWTAPRDGAFAFLLDTSGPEISVYLGRQIDSLRYLASSYSDNGPSGLVIRAVAGETYEIAVVSPYYQADFTLSWRPAISPPNDDFAQAQQISGASGSVTGTTAEASAEFGQPFNGFGSGATVWYVWTAPQSGRYAFPVTYGDISFGPNVTLYDGGTLDSLAGLQNPGLVGSNVFDVSAGSVYYLALDASQNTTGPFTLEWRAVSMQSSYEPYAFSTVSGRSPGKSDGAVASAGWNQPAAIAFDSGGNAYVADSRNHTIRKISSSGMVSTLAGSPGNPGSSDGQGPAARFNLPTGIAVDSAGVVYVSDSSNNTVRKITSNGFVTTIAGSAGHFGSRDGAGQAALFDLPKGITVGDGGNVYVADYNNGTIRKITPTGLVSTVAGVARSGGYADGAGSDAQFYSATSVAIDSSGNLFVADSNVIRKITPGGVVSTFAGSSYSEYRDGTGAGAGFYLLAALTVDAADNLWAADGNAVRKITPGAVVTTVAGDFAVSGSDDGSGIAARFNTPSGISAGPNGNIYVTDTYNETIRSVTPSGNVTTISGAVSPGSRNGPGAEARFDGPMEVAHDSSGNTYVADFYQHIIRKITPAGVTSTLAGLAGSYGSDDGVGASARFQNPRGVAVGSDDMIYVADTGNHTIRKITRDGTVSTIAGRAGVGGTTDGTGSFARFRSPFGLTVDSASNVYVADHSNFTIRKITPAGVVSTLAGLALKRGSADGVGSAARFYLPRCVVADKAGNVFVSDTNNHTIRKIRPDGTVSTIAGKAGDYGSGDGPGLDARFYLPTGLALDRKSNLYISERGNNTIRKITPAGLVTTLAGKPAINGIDDGVGNAATFDAPWGVAVDSEGRLSVTDTYNNTLRSGRRVPLSSLEISTPGNAAKHLEGTLQPNAEVQILAAANLANPFVLLATVRADAFGIYEFDDFEAASLPRRFYRVSVSSARSARSEIRGQ